MKNLLFALFLFLFSFPVRADTLHFESVFLPDLLKTVYGQILKKGYIIEDGLSDKKLSLLMDYNNPLEAELMLNEALFSAGLIAVDRNGYAYIRKINPDPYSFVYRPKHRAISYLFPLVRAAYPHFFKADQVQPVDGDILTLHTPLDNHHLLNEFLSSLDTPVPQVLVSGVAYEVTLNRDSGHSLDLIASLLKDKLSLVVESANVASTLGASVFKFNGVDLKSALKILDTDTRFKTVSRPSVRVRSGGSAKFNSGSDVPILGSVVTNQGVTTQGIQYRSSGVLFDVQPFLFSESINLKIKQEVSSFVQTNIGVINSPTLNKRLIETDLDLKNGDVIMIGGLNDSTNTNTKSSLPFMKFFPFTDLNKSQNIETVMILQVNKI